MTAREVIDSKNSLTLFIKELDIKTYTPISANKVTTSLINHINVAQDMYIKKNLGTELYENLLAEWISCNYDKTQLPDGQGGGNTPINPSDTTDYKELYNQVFMPLVWWSYTIALPHIAIKVEEAGVMLNNTSFSESSGMVGLDRLVAETKAVANTYTGYLIKYVCDTFTKAETDDKKVVGSGKDGGIFVPKRPWHNNNGCAC